MTSMNFIEDFLEEYTNNNVQEDMRTRKTKKFLTKALLELLEIKSLEEINVLDICVKAMVHRTTFYKHFTDKYELFTFVLDEIQNYIFDIATKKGGTITTKQGCLQFVSIILDFLNDNALTLAQIVKNNKSETFSRIFYDTFEHSIKNMLEQNQTKTKYKLPIEILAYFITGGFTRLAVWWLSSNTKYSKRELLKYINILIDEKLYLAD